MGAGGFPCLYAGSLYSAGISIAAFACSLGESRSCLKGTGEEHLSVEAHIDVFLLPFESSSSHTNHLEKFLSLSLRQISYPVQNGHVRNP